MKEIVYPFLLKDLATLQQEEEEDQRKEAEMEARWKAKEAAKATKKAQECAARKQPTAYITQCRGNGTKPCIFSHTAAGQPAQGKNGVCMFCDEGRFPLFAQTRNGKGEITKALAFFEKNSPLAFECAMQQ
eukprot:4182299-Karenia_brevis.AAC.1